MLIENDVLLFLLNKRPVHIVHSLPDGPVYIVVGTAGATTQVPFLPVLKHWMKFRSDDFGISKFKAYNSTHMNVNWYLDKNGTVGDSFWIERS